MVGPVSDVLNNLTELLRELPGIGPRQARRLAHWFVRKDKRWVDKYCTTLISAQKSVFTCSKCQRLFQGSPNVKECALCADSQRDSTLLMLVEKDVDLENIERTGTYTGKYFILGGTTSLLDKDPEKRIRISTLLERLAEDLDLREVIFALSATTEGEDTAAYVKQRIEATGRQPALVLSELGRGLSTGTELEYVDTETMKNALSGRH